MPLSTGPTGDWNQVTLRWAGVTLDGQPVAGSLSLTYSSPNPLLDEDATFPVSIYPVELKKTLTTATIQVLDENGQSVNRTVGYAEWTVPASDDPDIQGFGGTYTLTENLTNARGQTRNFVASKDAPGGVIWVNRITSVNAVPGQAVSAVSVAEFTQLKAQVSQITGSGTGGGTFSGVPIDGSVTNVKVASNAAINADKLVSGTTNKIPVAADLVKLAGIAAGATANQSDAYLLNRGNHQGGQLHGTISDWDEAVEDTMGAMAVRGGGTYDDANGIIRWAGTTGTGGAPTLDTMPAGYTHTISLNTAKTYTARTQITSRTDIRIVVVGGAALSEWTSPWLQDSWDKWELVPVA